ncbi:helix-turn-helix domain-containing protein [Lactococcus lactis]|uniref:helix-turn-helix domain-containing protein n=1 Tax=Lactococcus lactis TaxID=1358 RepID=UPI00223ADDBA|nr:helix-turn-helix transcriptional regulator [Lactococcus lactis]MCT0449997.1 XRE family transcriptional regulator [Lactococcus lactis subsp. lactis]
MNNLKEYREKKNLPQEKVAKLAGISIRVYQRYEQNEREPKISTAQQIAIALGIGAENVHKLFPLL